MITVPQGSGIHIIPLLLLRLSIGSLSRFTGVGGGFIATPALVVLGIPVDLAVGTSLFWVFLNSLAGSIIHRNLGNADVKLGIFLALPSMLGMETGIRLANTMRQAGLQDVAILSLSILLMIVIGTYTLFESLKRKAYIDQIGKGRLLASYQPTPLALKLQGIRLQPMIPFRKSGVTVSH